MDDKNKVKAVALFSGGLDSTLAIKLVLEQGVEVVAVHFVSAFGSSCGGDTCGLVKIAGAVDRLGVGLHVINRDPHLLELVKAPRHGYGSNMNPCIDCRIQMLRTAADHMRRIGASFLVSGEVLGQRPMSQRGHAMRLIDREAGLEGLVLRPLSAGLLKPTISEREGWVDRRKLPAISGRSRKVQMRLAEQYHITDYPSPAGGCLLTDPQFAHRLRTMLDDSSDLDMNDIQLLKHGRHFRLAPDTRVIVGRNELDNQRIESLSRAGDLLIELADVPGPTALLRGDLSQASVEKAASFVALYSKARTQPTARLRVRQPNGDGVRAIETAPAQPCVARQLMVVRQD